MDTSVSSKSNWDATISEHEQTVFFSQCTYLLTYNFFLKLREVKKHIKFSQYIALIIVTRLRFQILCWWSNNRKWNKIYIFYTFAPLNFKLHELFTYMPLHHIKPYHTCCIIHIYRYIIPITHYTVIHNLFFSRHILYAKLYYFSRKRKCI